MRSPDGTMDAIRISPISHHRDTVADVEFGDSGSEALDVANAFTADHKLIFRHETHRSRNILRIEDRFLAHLVTKRERLEDTIP